MVRNISIPGGAELHQSRWSIVLPYFNEEDFLETTLRSLCAQSLPARLILVDNGSTDTSPEIAAAFQMACQDLEIHLIREPTPGKAYALATGIAAVETPFVATADADTYYPPRYIERADRLFAEAGKYGVAALAFGAPPEGARGHSTTLRKGALAARAMPRQTHTGGYGQAFRTEELRGAGGFDPAIWPYCLMDHEIMHRLTKRHHGKGRLLYAEDHWCAPSPRRANRAGVRWTLPERLLYHVCPFERRDWFFYEFLASRFEARGLSQLNLRRKEWTAPSDQPDIAREEVVNSEDR